MQKPPDERRVLKVCYQPTLFNDDKVEYIYRIGYTVELHICWTNN